MCVICSFFQGSLFKPVCDEAFKPTVGMKFDDIASVEAFYKNYAHHVGFGVRLGPQRMMNNVIHWKRFLCAREGYRSTKGTHIVNHLDKNDSNKRRKRCDVMLIFMSIGTVKENITLLQ